MTVLCMAKTDYTVIVCVVLGLFFFWFELGNLPVAVFIIENGIRSTPSKDDGMLTSDGLLASRT